MTIGEGTVSLDTQTVRSCPPEGKEGQTFRFHDSYCRMRIGISLCNWVKEWEQRIRQEGESMQQTMVDDETMPSAAEYVASHVSITPKYPEWEEHTLCGGGKVWLGTRMGEVTTPFLQTMANYAYMRREVVGDVILTRPNFNWREEPNQILVAGRAPVVEERGMNPVACYVLDGDVDVPLQSMSLESESDPVAGQK